MWCIIFVIFFCRNLYYSPRYREAILWIVIKDVLVAELCVERGERCLDIRFELCGHIVLCMNLNRLWVKWVPAEPSAPLTVRQKTGKYHENHGYIHFHLKCCVYTFCNKNEWEKKGRAGRLSFTAFTFEARTRGLVLPLSNLWINEVP